ncbi:MAG TPA: serine/threonine-protein kinase [Kofleriaceae bacterium]|nr:serine/threonine-protein kinase [Kofleriaceae bacterium]
MRSVIPCIDANDAIALVQGELDGVLAMQVHAHVEQCTCCRELVGVLAKMPTVRRAPTIDTAVATLPFAHGAPDDDVDAGALIAERYEIRSVLGSGAMGVVYEAHDRRLDRIVALKRVRGMRSPAAHERLVSEARTMAQLSHPSIVTVFDAGIANGAAYIAMELVDGETLRAYLATPRSWRELVAIFGQTARALGAAHTAGIVHGDFKPDNVLVDRAGRARVGDFGLARAVANADDDRGAAGTPAYMAPELLAGARANAASDQFALCVSLYEALHGARPFAGRTVDELRVQHARGVVVTVRPAALRRVLERGLAAEPDARFGSLDALADALAAIPKRRAVVVGVGASLLGVAASTVIAVAVTRAGITTEPAVDPCIAAADAELAESWNADRAAAIERAFAGVDVAYARPVGVAATKTLGDYARRWRDQHVSVCRTTQLLVGMDERMSCLYRKRRHVDALVDRLLHVDAASVAAVPDAVAALPSVEECREVSPLAERVELPTEPAAAARYRRLSDELDTIEVARDFAEFDAGLARLTRLLPEVDVLGVRALRARYRYVHGELLEHLGKLDEAAAVLEASLADAEASRDRRTKLRALLRLYVVAITHRDRAAIDRWSRLAEAAVDGSGDPPAERAYLLTAQGMQAYQIDDYPTAGAKFEQALAIVRREPDGDGELGLLLNLGDVAYMQERDADAKRYWSAALARAQSQYGELHPMVGKLLVNTALSEHQIGDLAASIAHLERALAIYRATVGERHFLVGNALRRLAESEVDLPDDQADAAKIDDHFRTAAEILDAAYGKPHPDTADTLLRHAMYAARRGEHARALALYQRSLAMRAAIGGADDPALFKAVHGVGAELIELGRPREAIGELRRALALHGKSAAATIQAGAFIERDLADALAMIGRRGEAKALRQQALAHLRAAKGDFSTEIAALERATAR